MNAKAILDDVMAIKPLDRLLDFMSQHRSLQRGQSRIHLELRDFIASFEDLSCMGITSIPLKGTGSNGATFMRWVYNFKAVKRFYPEDVIEEIASYVKCSSPCEKMVEFKKIGDYNLVFYVVGIDQNQKYIAFNAQKDNFKDAPRFFEVLGQYLRSQFEQVLLIEEMKKTLALVHVDDVTGLYNQRKLVGDLEYYIDRYNKESDPFAVLFIDVDHFKTVNDGHGHLVGTSLLKELGEIIKNVLREKDLVYRYGGDEFVVLLPDVDGIESKQVGSRLLKSISSHTFIVEGVKEFKLSVSIGIGRFPIDAKNKNEILSIADQMMYHAKSQGRGKVCFAGELYDLEK